MTAFNAVRFRVKPGREQEFLDAHRNVKSDWPGLKHVNIIKTGERTYCIIAEWTNMDARRRYAQAMPSAACRLRPQGFVAPCLPTLAREVPDGGDLIGKPAGVACEKKNGGRGRYPVGRLLDQHGRDGNAADWLTETTADVYALGRFGLRRTITPPADLFGTPRVLRSMREIGRSAEIGVSCDIRDRCGACQTNAFEM